MTKESEALPVTRVAILDSQLIPRENIHPNPWNPNEQSDETFEALKAEILADGFGNPLGLVPISRAEHDRLWLEVRGVDHSGEPAWTGGNHYLIIEGEHRWRAGGDLGMEKMPAYLYDDWDETEQRLKTVRRNLISGDLNARKFTDLVRSLEGRIDSAMLPKMLGFDDERQFRRHLLVEKDAKDKSFIDGLATESKRERFALDSIHDIVTSLFADSADTLDQDYLIFTHKGSMVMVVMADEKLKRQLVAASRELKTSGDTATNFFRHVLEESGIK